jgi:hypothetical protein
VPKKKRYTFAEISQHLKIPTLYIYIKEGWTSMVESKEDAYDGHVLQSILALSASTISANMTVKHTDIADTH